MARERLEAEARLSSPMHETGKNVDLGLGRVFVFSGRNWKVLNADPGKRHGKRL